MKTNRQPEHLTDQNLAAIMLGMQDFDSWEEHLNDCPDCLRRAAEMNPTDTFVELLAAAKTRLDNRAAKDATLMIGSDNTPSTAATMAYVDLLTQTSMADDPPPELRNHPKYRPLRKLGSGGMGAVWLVEHLVMQRLVAVKAICPELLSNSKARERFLREIRAVAQLQHPNIVTAFDAEESNGVCLLVMEYVPGEILSNTLENGPLSIAAACRAVRDAARGLHRAHEAGLVHRDIKPSNLIRTPDGTVKILDFGLVAAGNESGSGLTGENMVMGTADYIAPEQAEEAARTDARADIYSLGCTLYHLLAGRVPFPHASALKKLDAHRTEDPKPIADLPEPLVMILNRMMAKDPAKRFPTAQAVAEALEPFCQEPFGAELPQALEPSRQALVPDRPRRWSHKLIAAGLLLGLLGLGTGAAIQYRVQTDRGELLIETVDENVEVVIKQGGKVVTVYDPKSQQKILLNSGTYELELEGKPSGLKLDLDQATLKRGEVVIARIIRAAAAGTGATTSPVLDAQQALPPTCTLTFDAGDRFGTIDISPDGRLVLATRSQVNLARVYEAATGRLVRELPHAFTAKFTPDGKHVVTGDYATMRVFELETGKMLREFGEGYHLWNLQPAATGTLLYGHFARRAQVWDWSNGQKINEFPLFTDQDRCMLSPDGRFFARQTQGKPPIDVFETQTGNVAKQYDTLRLIPDTLGGLTPDGALLLSYNDNEFITHDVATGREIARYSNRQPASAAAAKNPSKYRFIRATSDRYMLGIYDMESGGKIVNLIAPLPLEGRFDYRLSASGTTATMVQGKALYIWNLNNPGGVRQPELTPQRE